MAAALQRVCAMVAAGGVHHVVTLNAEMAVLATRDAEFGDIVRAADMVVPDGAGIVWAAKVLGRRLPARVAGYDLMLAIAGLAAERGEAVFLLGGRPGIADTAAKALCARYPELRVAGTHHGYFAGAESGVIADAVNKSGATYLFVALGAPKQEKWIAEHKAALAPGVKVCMGVGGSFDVLAGVVARAPDWAGRMGLEWLYRLVTQPRRAGRMLALPRFAYAVLLTRLKTR
ncbi:MAG TPA: WecB/TagA/CpsF family glycosyltransferase [Firmicutes bacterium]|nr:WecB/TagA/CpsF family glycosyltransferase [Bacillota bacterium]